MKSSPIKPVLRFTRDTAFLYGRARVHWREERYGEALQLLHLALEREPDNPRLLLAKARVLSMMGAFDLSRREAIRLLAMRRHVEEAMFLLGAGALALGRAQEASAYLWQYMRSFPRGRRIDEVEDLLGQVELKHRHQGIARRYSARNRLRESIRKGEWTYAGHLLERLYRKGRKPDAELLAFQSLLDAARGEAHQALRQAKQAYLLAGDNLYVLCAMAMALTMEGFAPLGTEYLRRAVESVQDLPAACYVVHIAGKLGAHNLCYYLLRELHRKLPEHLMVLRLLVIACHNVGALGEAAHQVRRYRALDPEDPVAAALEKHCAQLETAEEKHPAPLPYDWTFPPGAAGYLSQLLPSLRQSLPRPEALLAKQQGYAKLLRWGLHAEAVTDDEALSLVELLRQLPCEPSRILLREVLLLPHRSPLVKRAALEALSEMGDQEPRYIAYRRRVVVYAPQAGGAKQGRERYAAHRF